MQKTKYYIYHSTQAKDGKIIVAAYDRDIDWGNETPDETHIFSFDEIMGWLEIDYYEGFVSYMGVDEETGDIIFLTNQLRFYRNTFKSEGVKLSTRDASGYHTLCSSSQNVYFAGTNGHVMKIEGDSQEIISDEIIAITEYGISSIEELNVDRYLKIAEQPWFFTCSYQSDKCMFFGGDRGAAMLYDGKNFSKIDVSKTFSMLGSLPVENKNSFYVCGSDPMGVIIEINCEGSVVEVARSTEPLHLLDIVIHDSEIYVVAGESAGDYLFKVAENNFTSEIGLDQDDLGRGVGVHVHGGKLTAVFENCVATMENGNWKKTFCL